MQHILYLLKAVCIYVANYVLDLFDGVNLIRIQKKGEMDFK